MTRARIIYRIDQVVRYFFPKFSSQDEDLAQTFLSKKEFKLYMSMGEYDRKHSVNIARDILKNDKSKEKDILIRLAFMHDVGKEKSGIFSRVKKVLLGSSTDFHETKGYEKMKNIDEHMAWLVLNHHDKETKEEVLKIFQVYDDRN